MFFCWSIINLKKCWCSNLLSTNLILVTCLSTFGNDDLSPYLTAKTLWSNCRIHLKLDSPTCKYLILRSQTLSPVFLLKGIITSLQLLNIYIGFLFPFAFNSNYFFQWYHRVAPSEHGVSRSYGEVDIWPKSSTYGTYKSNLKTFLLKLAH